VSIEARFGAIITDDADQFEGCVLGRTLIMDGDSACYSVTAKCAKLETAQRRFISKVYEAMFLTKAEFARVHLTPKGCYKNGRHLLLGAKPYQANRKDKDKPPQLEPLRASAPSLFTPDDPIAVYSHMNVEADDAVMMDAYNVANGIVWSEDKDLNIVPCSRYSINTGKILTLPKGDRYGWIGERYTENGKVKSDGHGTKFFWLQMLMGDTADNVKGILRFDGALCGELTALRILDGISNENHAANLVINAYRAINQNPLPEAEALWLVRSVEDTGAGYIWSLDLTPENRAFIIDCFNRPYRIIDDE
jgi:hypothetical protein